MIDLHCHLLPRIDDGAQSLDEALALARAAVANGIRQAVLTPHVHPSRYANTRVTLTPHFKAFQMVLRDENIPLEIHLGGEVRLELECLTLLGEDNLPTLGGWQGSRVMLLEFPPAQIPVGAMKAVEFFLARGVVPMIAHPERNKDVIRNWRAIEPFVKAGCLLQLTAASVCGMFGDQALTTSQQLLEAGWVTVLATDAHNLEHRPPVLAEGRQAIEERYGEPAAELLTQVNPGLIVGAR